MSTKSLSFELLPQLAISEGATTPNPGQAGSWAWSTTLSAPVQWNGTNWRSTQNAISVGTTAPSTPYTGQLWLDIS